MENQKNDNLNMLEAIALADIYHTSTDYLLGRTNDPKPPVSL